MRHAGLMPTCKILPQLSSISGLQLIVEICKHWWQLLKSTRAARMTSCLQSLNLTHPSTSLAMLWTLDLTSWRLQRGWVIPPLWLTWLKLLTPDLTWDLIESSRIHRHLAGTCWRAGQELTEPAVSWQGRLKSI